MLITRTSIISGITRTLDIPCTEEQYKNYENGTLIQRAMPNVSSGDREFILNGLTCEEWQEFSDWGEGDQEDFPIGIPIKLSK